MSIEFENKYVVVKREDIEKYLDPEGQRALYQCLDVITEGRGRDGKIRNTYLVINTDEPYAGEAAQIMKEHGHYTPDGEIIVASPAKDLQESQYKRALNEVCADLACDDQCPNGEPNFTPWPECANCPGNRGEIHQDTERDIKCWERYYLDKALADLAGQEEYQKCLKD